ncbi:MAG: hypothetical protein ABIB71_01525 [Candidatus Woesearchaeota archaeon]
MYYLIEKYKDYEAGNCRGRGYVTTMYDVREFRDLAALEKALLKGSRHGGELIPTNGLEFKLTIGETEAKKWKK